MIGRSAFQILWLLVGLTVAANLVATVSGADESASGPQLVAPANAVGDAATPERVPAPLPERPAAGSPLVVIYGPPLAALDAAYRLDKQVHAALARQYDHLVRAYPSAWAHYPYYPSYLHVCYPAGHAVVSVSTVVPHYGVTLHSDYGPAYRGSAYRATVVAAPTRAYRPAYDSMYGPYAPVPLPPIPWSKDPDPAPSQTTQASESTEIAPPPGPQPETIPLPPANGSRPQEF